ncbi:MAG: AAA family ATPase [Fimbriiglobus sp.]
MPTTLPRDEAPRHGDRGLETPAPPLERPAALTIAISREAGARGHSIAAAIGKLLGWPVYPQDHLDFLAQDESAQEELLRDLTPSAVAWAEIEAAKVIHRQNLTSDDNARAVVQLIYTLAARGEAVLVGRGAGFLLPRETTVHVRVVAPFPERSAYLAQWLRLTEAEAAKEAIQRDARRAEFISKLSDLPIHAPTTYDLMLNGSRLSTEMIARTIAELVRAKTDNLAVSGDSSPDLGDFA